MPRRYCRYYTRPRAPRRKYETNRNFIGLLTNASTQTQQQIVAPSPLPGVRKLKHLRLQLALTGAKNETGQAIGDYQLVIPWALVYVPQGESPGLMNLTTVSSPFYQPANQVLASGVYDPSDGGGFGARVPFSKNLNSGDRVFLIATIIPGVGASGVTATLQGMCTYFIAY
uniref:Capsid protein n=1 Tax=unidentified TaxID=32644 RepID=A0A6G9W4B6_9ZZZZ|nr:hypothetical protein [unidentified]